MPSILTLEKISKRFGAVVVADNIDLTLLRGEALGIIGPNGAGKTTLFGIITGTVAPDAGRVVFEGHDVTRMKPEHRCRMGLARSFQVPQPFGGMTVFENLLVAAAFGGGRSEREVYAGHIWRVVVGTFEGPDGTTFDRDIVRSPGAVGAAKRASNQRATAGWKPSSIPAF
jgi:ABC-type branched-subunit amino acid transport system ATPase component